MHGPKQLRRLKKRLDVARRVEDLQQRSLEYKRKRAREEAKREADRAQREAELKRDSARHEKRRLGAESGRTQSRQVDIQELLKRKRVICESDD